METSLPPEIYANIISYLFFDTPSLKSCSLVCSNFRWLAQAQLFHDFTVHLLGNNEDHERMNLFLSSNEDSCRVIVGFTKTLTVLKNWELRHSATPAVAAVLSHWEDSSTLHHIRLVCDVIHLGWDAPRRDGLIDDYIDHPLVSSTIVRLANGRSLDLDWNGIRDDFILPLLSKTRQIDSIRLHKCHLPAGIAHLGKKFSPLYIRLGHITRIEPEISGVIFNGGRCQALTLASSFRNEVISLLFHQTGATLRHLTWKLSLCAYSAYLPSVSEPEISFSWQFKILVPMVGAF
ncbi:hypothetical protein DL96DRAFT_1710854 [Flagelloscypha sp. PMI_526]|nr:hypothetical protein DL96DRAFT_1710854 [Flagelloscypha sp. PMI_526]